MKVIELIDILPPLQLIRFKFNKERLLTPFLCIDTDFEEILKYSLYEIRYIITTRIIDELKYKDTQAIQIVIEQLDLAEK